MKGKIVVCDDVDGSTEAKRAGALGVILPNSFEDVSFILPLPGLSLTEDKLNAVKSYMNSTKYVFFFAEQHPFHYNFEFSSFK